MNPNTPNMDPALLAAIKARSQGQAPVGQLDQTSQAPLTPPVPSAPMSMPSTPPSGQPSLEPQPESQMIVKALQQRLNSISSVEKAKVTPSSQSMPVGY